MYSLFWHNALQEVPLVDVGTSNVPDLACAYNSFSWLVMRLCEAWHLGHIHAENVDVRVLDLLEAFQAWEGAPEHYGVGSA